MHFCMQKTETAVAAFVRPSTAIVYHRTASAGTDAPYGSAACFAFAARSGITVLATVTDVGVGGTTDCLERRGFIALLARLAGGDVPFVLVEEPARIARDLRIFAQALELIEGHGALVLTAGGDRLSDRVQPPVIDVSGLCRCSSRRRRSA